MLENNHLINAIEDSIHRNLEGCQSCSRLLIEPLAGGIINLVAKVCDPDFDCEPVVVTVYPTNPHEQLSRLARVMELTQDLEGVPIQHLISVDYGDTSQSGFDIAVKEYIPGKTVGKALECGELSAERIQRLVGQLGGILSQIHSKLVPSFGKLSEEVTSQDSWDSWFSKRFLGRLNRLEKNVPNTENMGIPFEEVRQLIPQLHELIDESSGVLSEITIPHLLHHDFHFLNMITDGENITGILDWENATGGDPLFDVAFLEAQLFLNRRLHLALLSQSDEFQKNYDIAQNKVFSSDRRRIYLADCSLSYFEALLSIPQEKVSEQVFTYAREHLSILRSVVNKDRISNIEIPGLVHYL